MFRPSDLLFAGLFEPCPVTGQLAQYAEQGRRRKCHKAAAAGKTAAAALNPTNPKPALRLSSCPESWRRHCPPSQERVSPAGAFAVSGMIGAASPH